MTARDGWKSRKQLNDIILDAYWQQNDCQGWRLIKKTRWTLWYCFFYVKQSTDTDRSISKNAKKSLFKDGYRWNNQQIMMDFLPKKTHWMIGPWLIIHAENDQSWRMLFENSKERYELGRLPVKQTINHDWCILIKTIEY